MASVPPVQMQPADETPMIAPPLVDGSPAPAGSPPAASTGSGSTWAADSPEVVRLIQDTGDAAANTLGELDELIEGQISSVESEAQKQLKAIKRQIDAQLKDVEEQASQMALDAQAGGVPVSWSPQERAAELSDVTGAGILNRVNQVLEQSGTLVNPPALSGCDPTTNPVAPSVEWRWVGGLWRGDDSACRAAGGSAPAPLEPGLNENDSRVVPCVGPCDPAPAPGPNPGPTPGEPPPCQLWAVETDAQGVSTVGVPAEMGASVDPVEYTLAFDSSNGRGRWLTNAPRDYVPMPPGSQRLRSDGPMPDLPYASALVCDTEPTSPPPSPPAPPTPEPNPTPPTSPPPPPGVCCPPSPIFVNVPSKPCPTSPPIIVMPPPPPKAPEPEPVKPIKAGPGDWTTPYSYWDDPGNCAQLAQNRGVYGLNEAAEAFKKDEENPSWWTWVGKAGLTASWVIPGLSQATAMLLSETLETGSSVGRAISERAIAAEQALSFWKDLPKGAVPNPDVATSLGAKLGMVKWIESITHAPFSYLFQSTVYTFQWANPQYIPLQAEVDRLYLNNRIADDYWECLTRANGNLPRIHRAVRDSKRTIPGITEVTALRRRSILSTDAAYLDRMRELGVTDPGHAAEFYKLSEFVPPFTDIIRMMVRDSSDEEVAAKYGYDLGFNQKFSGQLRKWAADQGIPEDVALQLWRAHWRIPSPTQLYEMLHRLRGDRPEYLAWVAGLTAAGDKDKYRRDNPEPPVVGEADVRYALEVDDMAPAWIDSEIAISYRPLTNTDARRAFVIGSMDRNELYNAMLDNGYSPANAEKLTRFYEAEKNRSLAAQTGVLSARKILAAFREGLIDELEADVALTPAYADRATRQEAIYRASNEREIETRRVLVKSRVKQFVYGEIDLLDLQTTLAQLGIVGVQMVTIQTRAEASRNGHMKEIRIQYVLDLFRRGLINRNAAWDRMTRLGYSPEDIALMLELAGALETEAQAARAARASDKARREAKAARQEAIKNWQKYEADLKARIKEEEKRLKDLENQKTPQSATAG